MTTIQDLLDILNSVEDKTQSIGIFCGGRYSEIGEVTSDGEGYYLEAEEK